MHHNLLVLEPKQINIFSVFLLSLSNYRKAFSYQISDLKWARFVHKGDPYRRRLEILKSLQWEMNISYTSITRLNLPVYKCFVNKIICNLSLL
jgi:hypothetical protein